MGAKQIAVRDRYLMSETSFTRVKFVLKKLMIKHSFFLANSASNYFVAN